MKNIVAYATLGLLVGSSSLLQAQTATTPAVGFTTINLEVGNNFVGFSLMPVQVHQGAFDVNVDRTQITLLNTTITNDQFNPPTISASTPATHIIEIITAGANQGLNTLIVDSIATGSQINLQDALPAGVANGSELRIWKLWTIGDAFGASNSAGLTGGTSSTAADLIKIPLANGSFDQYFYSTGGFGGVGWRKVGGGSTNQAGVPLYYSDGFIILAKTAKSLTITGQVKSGATQVVLITGNNFVTNLCPVNAAGANPSPEGRTLGNSGLYTGNPSTGLLGNTSASTADTVYIPTAGTFEQYFYSTGGFSGVGWRKVGGGSTNQAGVALPDGAVRILRRGADVSIQLAQGNF